MVPNAERFLALHHADDLLLLPNAWDALSAKIFAEAGAKAIATTSAGLAAVFGYADGERLPKALLLSMIERIVHSVSIPVSVDLEAGYGDTPTAVAETIKALLDRGVVGINLEDGDPHHLGQLLSIDSQVAKITEIKTVAQQAGVSLFLNARTDTFWLKHQPDPLAETLRRLTAYQTAGADGVFVPGLTDTAAIKRITQTIALPLNLLAGPWIKDVAALKALGVSRLSTGSALIRESVTHLQKQVSPFINEHRCDSLSPTLSYEAFNQMFVGYE